jgi:hypothetical protein
MTRVLRRVADQSTQILIVQTKRYRLGRHTHNYYGLTSTFQGRLGPFVGLLAFLSFLGSAEAYIRFPREFERTSCASRDDRFCAISFSLGKRVARVRPKANVAGSRCATPVPRSGCPHASVGSGVVHRRARDDRDWRSTSLFGNRSYPQAFPIFSILNFVEILFLFVNTFVNMFVEPWEANPSRGLQGGVLTNSGVVGRFPGCVPFF